MPKVSIIIPSYNHGDFLIDRLESIAGQTYADWEAIIIDDKSSDDSVEIIKNFLKENPTFNVKHFIINEKNSGGGYKSWKKGIELATTEFIWIAETDDYSSPEFLEEMVAILEYDPKTALAFCNSNYVDSNKEFLYDSSKRTSILNVEKGNFKILESSVLLNSMPLNPLITNGSSVVFRKPSNEIPQELLQHKQMSDLFLWTYLIKNNSFGFLNKNLNFFRRHEDSTTTKNLVANQERLYEEMVFYANYFQLSKAKSKAIISHFINNFLLSKKAYGLFYRKPFEKINNTTQLEIKWFYIKIISQAYIKKIIKF